MGGCGLVLFLLDRIRESNPGQNQIQEAGPGPAVGAFCGCPVLPIQPVCPHCSSASTSVKPASPDTTTTSGPCFQNKTPCIDDVVSSMTKVEV